MNLNIIHIICLLGFTSCFSFGQFSPIEFLNDDISNPFIEIADLNNDNNTDFVLTSRENDEIRIYLNDGLGNFDLDSIIPANITDPTRLLLEDIDNDGNTDIISMILNTDFEIILYRGNGDGTFGSQEVVFIPPDANSVDFCLSDNDNDNYPELIIHNNIGGYTEILFIENLAGNFQGVYDQIINVYGPSTNNIVTYMQSIDMDNDGDLDVMTKCNDNQIEQGEIISFWLNNDGNGNYTKEFYWKESLNGDGFFQMTDMNGDNIPDYVYTQLYSTFVAWNDSQSRPYEIGVGAGNANIIQPYNEIEVEDINDFRVSDIDGDNDQDVIMQTWNAIYVFENDGTNSFTPVKIYHDRHNYSNAGDIEHFHFRIDDLNNDGNKDLLVVNLHDDDLFWLENQGSMNFTQHLVTYNVSNPRTVFAADHDQDGVSDIYTALYRKRGLHKFNGLGSANFTEVSPLILDTLVSLYDYDDFQLDMDGDGDLDILLSQNLSTFTEYYWLENTPTDPYSTIHRVSIPQTKYIEVADIDNDGFKDLIIGGYNDLKIQYGLGGGSFETAVTILPEQSLEIHVLDLDGDGLKDIVWYDNTFGTWSFRIIKNLGNRQYDSSTPPIFNTGNSVAHMDFGDVNDDGLADAICGDDNSEFGAYIYLNQGNMDFTQLPPIYSNWNTNMNMVQSFVEDVDMDGDNDIVGIYDIGNSSDWKVKWHENTGGFNYIEHVILTEPNIINDVVFEDINNDLDLDFLLAFENDRIGYLSNEHIAPRKIEGTVFIDIDENGELDSTDVGFPYANAQINVQNYTTFTNSNGYYFYSVDTGQYVISVDSVDTSFWELSTDSATYTLNVDSTNQLYSDINFGYKPISDSMILTSVIPGVLGRCDEQVDQEILVKNEGYIYPSGYLRYELDTNITLDYVSPAPDSIVNNAVYWSFDSLFYFENFEAHCYYTTPPFDPAIDSLRFNYTLWGVDSLGNDSIVDSIRRSIPFTCSYDPNNKVPDDYGYTEEGFISPTKEYIEYTVNFQNTGNDTAYNVKINDYLDSNIVWSSFEVLAASDALNVNLSSDGLVEFMFNDIYLPDSATEPQGSKGFVTYKVRLKNNIEFGDSIKNFAAIYFDQNPPIITNSTIHTLFDCNTLKQFNIDSTNFCMNDSTLIEATSNYLDSLSWSLAAAPVSSNPTIYQNFDTTGVYEFELFAQNPICQVDTTFSVDINYERPSISLSDTIHFCEGSSVELNTSIENTSWYTNNNLIAQDSLITVSNDGLYEALAGQGQCISKDTVTLIESLIPMASITSSSSDFYLCDSSSIDLYSGNVENNVWTLNSQTLSTSDQITADTSGWYVLEVENTPCPADKDSVLVSFFNPQHAEITTNNTTFCQGDSSVLYSQEGTNNWSYILGNFSTDTSVIVYDQGWYYLEYADSVCPATTDSVYITVEQPAMADIMNGQGYFCEGDSLEIESIDTANNWYYNNTLIGTDQTIFCDEEGWYILEVEGNLCPNQFDSTYITQENVEQAIINATDSTLCPGDEITLSTSASSYSWFNENGNLLTTGNAMTINNGGWYILEVDNGVCNMTTDSIEVISLTTPNGPYISFYNDSLFVSDTLPVIQWYQNGSPIAGANDYYLALEDEDLYGVMITFSNGCSVFEEYEYDMSNLTNYGTNQLAIYPNPVTSILNIEFSNQLSRPIKVYDVTGRLVIEKGSDALKLQIDVSKLEPGTYSIVFEWDNSSIVKRVVVQ